MPHLRFRAVSEENVKQLSENLLEPLAFTLGCPEDYFTFEYVPNVFYYGGEKALNPSPTIEVHWFTRTQDQQNLVAQMIHEALTALGYEETIIIFKKLEETAYYDNGQHY